MYVNLNTSTGKLELVAGELDVEVPKALSSPIPYESTMCMVLVDGKHAVLASRVDISSEMETNQYHPDVHFDMEITGSHREVFKHKVLYDMHIDAEDVLIVLKDCHLDSIQTDFGAEEAVTTHLEFSANMVKYRG